MTRFTTDPNKYQSEIRRLLTKDFDSDWKPLWNYFEMTQLLSYGYSITFLVKENISSHKLLFRNWRNNLKFETEIGIFNLDKIIIDEIEFNIKLNDIYEIQELIKGDISILKTQFIILDGYFKEFNDYKSEQKIKWNIDEQMNEHLAKLIFKIRQINAHNKVQNVDSRHF